MISASEAIDFCEKYYRKNGRPFTTKGRDWVTEELFEPALGWKVWPRNADNLCDKCAAEAGKILDWSPEIVRRYKRKKRCCAGLKIEKIGIVLLNLQRGAGKTTNTCALITALMCKVPKTTVSFVASAGAQARTIVEENILQAVHSHPKLRKAFTSRGNKLTFSRKNGKSSFFETLDSSPGSVTSRRRQFLFFDEARDIRASVLSALLPSIRAQSRFECPHGHDTAPYVPDTIIKCKTCKTILVPAIPTVIITSTSGIRSGGDRDWFDEMVEVVSEQPKANTHLYRDAEATNPDANELELGILETFGEVPSLREYIDAEAHNIPIRKGEGFVETAEIKAIMDRTLAHKEQSLSPTFAFLDTSLVGDLTSLVMVEDSSRSAFPWEHMEVSHIAYWNPKDRAQCPSGQIDPQQIMQYLARVLPHFPNLIKLVVDTRGQVDWARDLVKSIHNNEVRPLVGISKRIKGMTGNLRDRQSVQVRSAAWTRFEDRIRTRTLRSFPHVILERELRNMQRVITKEGFVEIRDKKRKASHADIAEGLAQCCHLVWRHQTRTMDLEKLNTSPLVKQFAEIYRGGLTGGLTEGSF